MLLSSPFLLPGLFLLCDPTWRISAPFFCSDLPFSTKSPGLDLQYVRYIQYCTVYVLHIDWWPHKKSAAAMQSFSWILPSAMAGTLNTGIFLFLFFQTSNPSSLLLNLQSWDDSSSHWDGSPLSSPRPPRLDGSLLSLLPIPQSWDGSPLWSSKSPVLWFFSLF